jgi:hypothetical protein
MTVGVNFEISLSHFAQMFDDVGLLHIGNVQ